MYGGGEAVSVIQLDAASKGTTISGNHFDSINGYAVTPVSGATYDIGINNKRNTTGIWNNLLNPTPTNLTVVGAATYNLYWDRKGNVVNFTLNIIPTGAGTTASTANSTYFAKPAEMPQVSSISDSVLSAVDDNVVSFGNGLISQAGSGRFYLPTWTARNVTIRISGTYRTDDAN